VVNGEQLGPEIEMAKNNSIRLKNVTQMMRLLRIGKQVGLLLAVDVTLRALILSVAAAAAKLTLKHTMTSPMSNRRLIAAFFPLSSCYRV